MQGRKPLQKPPRADCWNKNIAQGNRAKMESAEIKARAAIAMLREGLRDFDLQSLAKASTELVRTGVLQSSHGIELSNTV
jgi:hypothetical protein